MFFSLPFFFTLNTIPASNNNKHATKLKAPITAINYSFRPSKYSLNIPLPKLNLIFINPNVKL
ncbi:hypothetical protein BAC7755_56860 [Bacillus sp. MN7755]